MTGYPLKWIAENLAAGYAPRSEEDLESIDVESRVVFAEKHF